MVPRETVLFSLESFDAGKHQDIRKTKLTSFPRDHTLTALLYI